MDLRLGTVLVGTGAIMVVGAAVGAPAQAAAPRLSVVEQESALDSEAVKNVRAACPAGRVVYGGGASLVYRSPVSDQVKLHAVIPFKTSAGTYGISATAGEAFSYGLGWSLRVRALCGQALPGYGFVTKQSVNSSAEYKDAFANCGDGRVPVAVGGSVSADRVGNPRLSFQGTSLRESTAVPGGVLVGAHGREASAGYEGVWTAVVRAVCVNKPNGYRIAARSSAPDAGAYKGVNAPACPSGTQVYGAAGRVLFSPAYKQLVQLDPLPPTLGASVTGARERGTSETATWGLTAAAICAS